MNLSRRLILSLSAGFFAIASLIAAGGVLMNNATHAHAASWTQVWDDEFNGATNSAVDAQWHFDKGSNWGNNQVENDTTSTSNIFQDGNGHLVIKPINSGGSWTSGRIETVADNLKAPAGGELEVTASIQLPDVTGAAAKGYWPAFWMLRTCTWVALGART